MSRRLLISVVLSLWAAVALAAAPTDYHWQPAGGYAVAAGLAGPRGGPAPLAAWTTDGSALVVMTASGTLWQSEDAGDQWLPLATPSSIPLRRPVRWDVTGPTPETVVVEHPSQAGRLYALGRDLYVSPDQGRTWIALTREDDAPLIGAGQLSIAFDPADPERLVVTNEAGVWRSSDGGLTWVGLNAGLPNFPAGRFVGPAANRPPQYRLEDASLAALPAASEHWRLIGNGTASLESGDGVFERFLSGADLEDLLPSCAPLCRSLPDAPLTALAAAGESTRFVGTVDGRVWRSRDDGRTWASTLRGLPAPGDGRFATAIWGDPQSELTAVVVFSGESGSRIFRTVDGGELWDDVTADLPAGELFAVVGSADAASLYVAGAGGVHYAPLSLREPSPAVPWRNVSGDLPPATVRDLYLDNRAGRLYVSVAGHGIFRMRAPGVLQNLRLLNAADYSATPAAPGGLLTLLGASVGQATVEGAPAPVLTASEVEAQIQVPFLTKARGEILVRLATSGGDRELRYPFNPVAPAIFTDQGEGLVLDAGSGRLLGVGRGAAPGGRILVLANGLGAVDPVWPDGTPAPLASPPRVIAPVTAAVDGRPLQVVSATLAGGYIGMYLVEVELPMDLEAGVGELTIEAAGRRSNGVPLFISQ